MYTGYDGHGMMDVYEGTHEYKYVTKEELEWSAEGSEMESD